MHKSLDEFKFPSVGPLTTKLTVLELLKIRCLRFFLVAFDPIIFKLAGYKDMHKILDEFEF